MADEPAASPSFGGITADAGDGSAAAAVGRDNTGHITLDQSRQVHYHDAGRDDQVTLVRRITEGVPGFVGRADELDRLGRLLSPDAPRGGPLVLYPDNVQPGIGVTALALQAASRMVAAGRFSAAVHVRPHPGGEPRQLGLGRAIVGVLAALDERPERGDWEPGGEQAAYQRVMERRAAAGRPVLIVIEEVRESDVRLVGGLTAGGPHRLLLTAWEPPSWRWLADPQLMPVRYLDEDESVEFLTTALSPDFSGSRRPPDSPAHLRVLARRCGGVARELRRAADELAGRPELSVAELLQALADTYDHGEDAAGEEAQSSSLSRSLAVMTGRLAPIWGPPPQPVAEGRPVIGRRALLSWLEADHRKGRPAVWDVIAGPGSGKTMLLEAMAELASPGARVVRITMGKLAENYEQRRAGSGEPLEIELARTGLCMGVARIVGDKLTAASFDIEQHIYAADQEIQGLLASRPESRPDVDVANWLIPRGGPDAAVPLDPVVSAEYAGRVRAIRTGLGRGIADVLGRPPSGAGQFVVLIDNLHCVTDAACRRWLADLFCDRLETVTVVARRPGDQDFCEAAITYRLRDFTRAETLEYFRVVGGIDLRAVEERTLDAFMARRRGRPQAVAAQCDELTGRVQAVVNDLLDQAAHPAGTAADDDRFVPAIARQLVAQACREVLGRDLPVVMDFLVVLRHVNAGLLDQVLTAEAVTEDEAELLAARLARYSIMTSSDDDHPESFRLHEHIRAYLLDEMPPGTVRRRHERAERVYAEWVAGYEPELDPETGEAFTVWARFESPEFQVLLQEWLYHAMRSQGRQLSGETAVRITQVFLEAFWWWGFYLSSDVCVQLLREFKEISADKSDADQQWLRDLSTFYRNYRWGYVYEADESRDWALAGTALENLRMRAGLKPGKPMPRGRHAIDIITNVYLAQSFAFRDPGGEPGKAASYFAEARAAVRRSVEAGNEGHAWYDAWIVYETADMWSRCGRPERAGAELRELDALAAADTEGDLIDRDLNSRAADVHAEVYLARGDYARAIDACARAALQVYVYHVTQETERQPPNLYTYKRHAESIDRARECLEKVRERDPGAWRSGIRRMCAVFAPYWRLAGGAGAGQFAPPAGPWSAADGPALPEGIIPPVPADAYRGRYGTPFTELAQKLRNVLGPALYSWVPFEEPEKSAPGDATLRR